MEASRLLYSSSNIAQEVLNHSFYAHSNTNIIGIDALKSLLVIPRTPSPVPLEERELNELNVEQMRELLQRQRVS